jgi:hypothetical protein
MRVVNGYFRVRHRIRSPVIISTQAQEYRTKKGSVPLGSGPFDVPLTCLEGTSYLRGMVRLLLMIVVSMTLSNTGCIWLLFMERDRCKPPCSGDQVCVLVGTDSDGNRTYACQSPAPQLQSK